ncbi:hypothetical protein SAMN04489716_4825 [Actinoplanes derwentensis]|uniref:Uncharacterized protein n=2 Tax=Actinoplanes derwentensis TaxID=113562 RepID=A0A1H2BSH2_9ACTN|nr:hypothetical protein SAMN04489716_4825 [Actinoplanes derwentensis]
MEEKQSPLDRDLDAMAGDPRLSNVVRESLERLRSGVAGQEMAEMARDLLNGSIELRSLAKSPVYGDALFEGIEKYQRWESELSPEGRQELAETVRQTYGVDLNERPEPGR